MALTRFTDKAKKALKRLRGSIVQDCPPELYACEVCRKLECNDEEWLNCEKRLRAAEFIKSRAESASSSEIHCSHETGTNGERPAGVPSESQRNDD